MSMTPPDAGMVCSLISQWVASRLWFPECSVQFNLVSGVCAAAVNDRAAAIRLAEVHFISNLLSFPCGTGCSPAAGSRPAFLGRRTKVKLVGKVDVMPELPDITVYIEALERRILGQTLEKVRLGNPFL